MQVSEYMRMTNGEGLHRLVLQAWWWTRVRRSNTATHTSRQYNTRDTRDSRHVKIWNVAIDTGFVDIHSRLVTRVIHGLVRFLWDCFKAASMIGL